MVLSKLTGCSALAASLLCAALAGCGASAPDALTPKDFYSNSPQDAVSETPLSRTDVPGQIAPKEPHSVAEEAPEAVGPPVEGIPRAVQSVILPPGADLATTQPSISPTTLPTTEAIATTEASATTRASATTEMSPLTWYIMGSLVAEVNGTPIYANKVLRLESAVLREQAREYDMARFEVAARQKIEGTVNELVHDELEYAAADKSLGKEDKQLADALTKNWRETQISESGGSVELARRKFAADGKNFEEEVQEQHRTYMVQLYYTRKVNPQVQVSRTDIYRYYVDHLDSEYTTHDSATIDMVRGSRDAMDDFRKQLLAGGDFGDLSKMDGVTMKWQQYPLERGSFALKNVDAVIWNLQVGEVSQPIEDRGGFYVVKVDSRIAGTVQSFESEEVQDKIKQSLEREQLRKLRDVEQRKLMEGAIIRSDDAMIDECVAMAMENYSRWRNGK